MLSTGELSDFTQNVLRLGGIAEVAEDDPEAALATIHDAVVTGFAGPNAMFAYAELAFKHASEGGGRPYYLASAVYAFAYLFPDGEEEAPSPFDPRYRWAVELYNLRPHQGVRDGGRRARRAAFGRIRAAVRPARGDVRSRRAGVGRAAAHRIRACRRVQGPRSAQPLPAAGPGRASGGSDEPARGDRGLPGRGPSARAGDRRAAHRGRATRPWPTASCTGSWSCTRRPTRSRSRSPAARCRSRSSPPRAWPTGSTMRRSGKPSSAAFCSATCCSRRRRSSPRCSRTSRAVSRSCWCMARHRAPRAGPTWSTTSRATRRSGTASSSGSSATRPATRSRIPRCSCARRSSRRWHRSILRATMRRCATWC